MLSNDNSWKRPANRVPDRQTLLDLADFLETVEQPSAELDRKILTAIGGTMVRDGVYEIWSLNGERLGIFAPAYTSSIDAAATLVPDGCEYSVRRYGWHGVGEHRAMAFVYRTPVLLGLSFTYDAKSMVNPALALASAALRLRGNEIQRRERFKFVDDIALRISGGT